MKQKTSKAHLKAFDFAREKYDDDRMEIIFETLFYLCRLIDLDPKSVSVKLPGLDDEDSGIEICFLEAFEPDSEKDDYDLLPVLYEIRQHIVYNQKDSAEFCKVTERTLQRWVKDSGLKPIILGKHRVFREDDLLTLIERKSIEKIARVKIDFKNLIES